MKFVKLITFSALQLSLLSSLIGQVTVDSSGEVGIGTSSPREQLHVQGVVLAGDQPGGATNGSLALGIAYSGDHIINTFGSQYSSAATAIGYAVKPKPLAAGYVSSVNTWSAPRGVLEITNQLIFKNASAISSSIGTNVTLTERFRVNADGEVGIGDNNPTQLLDLKKVGGNAIVSIENTGNGNVSGIDFVRERATGAGVGGGSIFMESDTSGNDALLYLQAQTASAPAGLTTPLGANNGVRLILMGGDGVASFEYGKVGIGTTTPSEQLHVVGKVRATSFISDVGPSTGYADFVFDDDYALPSLSEVEAHIEEHGHLPDIPSEAEAMANGIDLAQMQVRLLQKIEELTLHQIAQEKRINLLEAQNRALVNLGGFN